VRLRELPAVLKEPLKVPVFVLYPKEMPYDELIACFNVIWAVEKPLSHMSRIHWRLKGFINSQLPL
jgi:hypothetical protein